MELRKLYKNFFVGGNLDVIFLSDHGMMNVYPRNVVDYSTYLDKRTYTVAGDSPIFEIKPKNGKKNYKKYSFLLLSLLILIFFLSTDVNYDRNYDIILNQLRRNAQNNQNKFKVYNTSAELPERYHANHPQFGPIIIEYAVGYGKKAGGAHGYDNKDPNMRAILIMVGDSFKLAQQMEKAKNVNLYNLCCRNLVLAANKSKNRCYQNNGHSDVNLVWGTVIRQIQSTPTPIKSLYYWPTPKKTTLLSKIQTYQSGIAHIQPTPHRLPVYNTQASAFQWPTHNHQAVSLQSKIAQMMSTQLPTQYAQPTPQWNQHAPPQWNNQQYPPTPYNNMHSTIAPAPTTQWQNQQYMNPYAQIPYSHNNHVGYNNHPMNVAPPTFGVH